MLTRRFGFRHVLPVVVTVGYVFLMMWGIRSEVRHNGMVTATGLRYAAFQEGTVEFHSLEPRPLSAPTRVALGLNFPACLVIALASAAFHIESEMVLVWGGAVLGCLLWYLVGRWVDIAIGSLSRKRVRHPNLRDLMLFIVVGPLSVVALLLSVLSMTPLNHHGGNERYWTGIFLVFWSGFLVAVMADVARYRNRP